MSAGMVYLGVWLVHARRLARRRVRRPQLIRPSTLLWALIVLVTVILQPFLAGVAKVDSKVV